MNNKELNQFIEKNKEEGFFVDNSVYQGYEENNKTFLIIEGNPIETNAFASNILRQAKSTVYFENKNPRMVMSKDSKEGFLYQQKKIIKQILIKSNEEVIIGDNIFEKDAVYSVASNNKIKKLTKEEYQRLTHYKEETDPFDIKEDKEISLEIAKRKQEKMTESYNKELKNKSSISSIRLKV
tara:strand:+ start:1270 stop:1815 length:546 start_codon:yes stop_codon:yes gene_type:complete